MRLKCLVCIVGACGTGGGNLQEAFGYMTLNLSEVYLRDVDVHLDSTRDQRSQVLGMAPCVSHRISLTLDNFGDILRNIELRRGSIQQYFFTMEREGY